MSAPLSNKKIDATDKGLAHIDKVLATITTNSSDAQLDRRSLIASKTELEAARQNYISAIENIQQNGSSPETREQMVAANMQLNAALAGEDIVARRALARPVLATKELIDNNAVQLNAAAQQKTSPTPEQSRLTQQLRESLSANQNASAEVVAASLQHVQGYEHITVQDVIKDPSLALLPQVHETLQKIHLNTENAALELGRVREFNLNALAERNRIVNDLHGKPIGATRDGEKGTTAPRFYMVENHPAPGQVTLFDATNAPEKADSYTGSTLQDALQQYSLNTPTEKGSNPDTLSVPGIGSYTVTGDQKKAVIRDGLNAISITTGLAALIPTPASPFLGLISGGTAAAAGGLNMNMRATRGQLTLDWETGLDVAGIVLGTAAVVGESYQISKTFAKAASTGAKAETVVDDVARSTSGLADDAARAAENLAQLEAKAPGITVALERNGLKLGG